MVTLVNPYERNKELTDLRTYGRHMLMDHDEDTTGLKRKKTAKYMDGDVWTDLHPPEDSVFILSIQTADRDTILDRWIGESGVSDQCHRAEVTIGPQTEGHMMDIIKR